ncbi:MAG: DUF805 domain-containing protein [Prevotellaceae bacterium]|jgi:uncharacterized membrane protein YhaH (DUF805 family)|nr:DUF805 domain-containing protein [Prevotellaceae bacterium]
MNWYLKVLKQYADFSGRARRTEYWMYTLFNVIAIFILAILMVLLALTGSSVLAAAGTILYYLYALAVLVPSLAVCVRRLHDIGKSGWFYFIGFIPFVGIIILLVWLCTDSQPGANNWGENPKEA